MKTHEVVKSIGFKSLKQVSDLGGESVQTLINWHKKYPRRFDIYLRGLYLEIEGVER